MRTNDDKDDEDLNWPDYYWWDYEVLSTYCTSFPWVDVWSVSLMLFWPSCIDSAFDYISESYAYNLCLVMMYLMYTTYINTPYDYVTCLILSNSSFMLMLMIYARHHI